MKTLFVSLLQNRYSQILYAYRHYCCLVIVGIIGSSVSTTSSANSLSTALISSKRSVGVSLDSIGMIIGATYDPKQKVINLIGNGQHIAASPSLQQIAVAFHWAISDSASHYFLSIDPLSSSPQEAWMEVRIAEAARNTDFGYIMLESDRIMKTITLGKDNITKESVDGYPCNSLFDDASEQMAKNKGWNRFWLYPHSNKVEISDRSIFIREARVGVKTEKLIWDGNSIKSLTGQQDPDAAAFANCFTKNYQQIAEKELIFRQLEQLMRLLLVSEWIREQKIPLATDWLDQYRSQYFQMPHYTPTIHNQKTTTVGRNISTQTLFGGTDLDVKPNLINQSPRARKWEDKAMQASLRNNLPGKFEFESEQVSYQGVSLPTLNYNLSPGKMERVASVETVEGPVIELFKREIVSPGKPYLRLNDSWELAIPKMSIYNPHGRSGQTKYINEIPIRTIDLYAPAGELLGRFKELEFNPANRRHVFINEGNNSWQVIPDETAQTLWAVNPATNTIWAFDAKTGLVKAQQIGQQLIQYQWSYFSGPFRQPVLRGLQMNEHSIQFEYGNGGLQINGLKTSDGRNIMFIPKDQAQLIETNLTHFNAKESGPTRIQIDASSGNWELIGERKLPDNYYLFSRHGRSIGQLLLAGSRRKRPYAIFFPDGGHTLVIHNGEITIIPFSTADFLRRGEYRLFPAIKVEGIRSMPEGRKKVLLGTEGGKTLLYLENGDKNLKHYFFGRDAEQLFQFRSEAYDIERTYIGMKEVNTLPDEMGLIDLRPFEDNKIIYSNTAGLVQIERLSPQTQRGLKSAKQFMESFYRDNNTTTSEQFLRETKSYYDYLQYVVDKLGRKQILTKEHDALDANLIWAMHKGDPTVHFFRDHPDLNRSIAFYQDSVLLERDSFMTISTFDWQFPETVDQYQNIRQLAGTVGVEHHSKVGWEDFLDILKDSTKQQLTVFTRSTEQGLIFADQEIAFERIEIELASLNHTKDLLNIIVDRPGAIQRLFSDSGKFRRVMISGCDYKQKVSIRLVMEHLQQIYQHFAKIAKISLMEFGKLFPNSSLDDLQAQLGSKISRTTEAVNIYIGKLNKTEKSVLTFGFLDQLKPYIVGPYKDYNIRVSSLREQSNTSKIEQIRHPAKNRNDAHYLKSILRLKVFRMQNAGKNKWSKGPIYTTSRYG